MRDFASSSGCYFWLFQSGRRRRHMLRWEDFPSLPACFSDFLLEATSPRRNPVFVLARFVVCLGGFFASHGRRAYRVAFSLGFSLRDFPQTFSFFHARLFLLASLTSASRFPRPELPLRTTLVSTPRFFDFFCETIFLRFCLPLWSVLYFDFGHAARKPRLFLFAAPFKSCSPEVGLFDGLLVSLPRVRSRRFHSLDGRAPLSKTTWPLDFDKGGCRAFDQRPPFFFCMNPFPPLPESP